MVSIDVVKVRRQVRKATEAADRLRPVKGMPRRDFSPVFCDALQVHAESCGIRLAGRAVLRPEQAIGRTLALIVDERLYSSTGYEQLRLPVGHVVTASDAVQLNRFDIDYVVVVGRCPF